MNVQIPLILGDVVNVVSKYTKEAVGNFIEDVKQPAIKLVQMYTLQVVQSNYYVVEPFKFILDPSFYVTNYRFHYYMYA